MAFKKFPRENGRLMMLVAFSLLLFVTSCGKIGDPMPPDKAIPRSVLELAAKEESGRVVLNWSMSERTGDVSHIRIMRSKAEAGGTCPSCEPEYVVIADLPVMDSKLLTSPNGIFSY